MKYEVSIGDYHCQVEISSEGKVYLDGDLVEVNFGDVGQSALYSLLVNHESFEALVEPYDNVWHVLMRGNLYEVEVVDERTQLLRSRETSLVPDTGEVAIRAPMPGLVVSIPVKVGQELVKGDNIIILESMKMENELKAPRAGRVERINVQEGESVEQDQTMVVLV